MRASFASVRGAALSGVASMLVLAGCSGSATPADGGAIVADATSEADATTGPDAATSCSFTACDGDPTGAWNLMSECGFTGTRMFAECPGATFAASDVTVRTTPYPSQISFNTDGSWGIQYFLSGRFTLTLPTACVSSTCEANQDALAARFSGEWTCAVAGDACVCRNDGDLEINQGGVRDSWTVDGSRVTATTPSGDTVHFDVCVAGSNLSVRDDEGIVTQHTLVE